MQKYNLRLKVLFKINAIIKNINILNQSRHAVTDACL